MPGTPRVDDRHSHFLIIVADACLAATMADLRVDLHLADGTQLSGVPSRLGPTTSDKGVDETGYAPTFLIGDDPVRLDAVIGCTVWARTTPEPPSTASSEGDEPLVLGSDHAAE